MASGAITGTPPGNSVRFGPEDLAIFGIDGRQRRAEALQERVLPRLIRLVEEALTDVRSVFGVDRVEDSLLSKWPNFRPRRERDIAEHDDSAFAGLGGRRGRGKWHAAFRKDGSPAQILPFRLGVLFTDDGLSVEFHNDWLTGLDAASSARPLTYLEGHGSDLDHVFRAWRVELAAQCEDWRPSRSVARTLAAATSSRDFAIRLVHRPRRGSATARAESARAALVRLFPIYDTFIQTAKGAGPRLGEMLARLGAPTTAGASSWAAARALRSDWEYGPLRRGAPPPVAERAASVVGDGPAETYAMELRGARGSAFKIGWAFRHEDRVRRFNLAAMPELGGIRYVPVLSQPWESKYDAYDMEQRVLRRLDARRHPANHELVTGVSRDDLQAAWATAAEATRQDRMRLERKR
jgi:hypothetical protein